MKISVTNSDPNYSILIDPAEFLPKLALLKDEMMKLKGLAHIKVFLKELVLALRF